MRGQSHQMKLPPVPDDTRVTHPRPRPHLPPVPELIPDPHALGVRMRGRVGVRVDVMQRGVRGGFGGSYRS